MNNDQLQHAQAAAKAILEVAKKRAEPLALGHSIGGTPDPDLFVVLMNGYAHLAKLAMLGDFNAIKSVAFDAKEDDAIRQVACKIVQVALPGEAMPEYFPFVNCFEVAAGKYESEPDGSSDKNYKVIDRRTTMADALDLRRECLGYHFVEFEYIDPNGKRWEVELTKVEK